MAEKEKVTITAADVGELKVVEAADTATTSRTRGPNVEQAMADAVLQVSREAEEIWAEVDKDDPEDVADAQEEIKELTSDENVLRRKMEARAQAKAAYRQEQDRIAAQRDDGR